MYIKYVLVYKIKIDVSKIILNYFVLCFILIKLYISDTIINSYGSNKNVLFEKR